MSNEVRMVCDIAIFSATGTPKQALSVLRLYTYLTHLGSTVQTGRIV